MKIVLASESEEKRKVVENYLKDFSIIFRKVNVDEKIYENAEKTAVYNALAKTEAVEGDVVVASDCFVYFNNSYFLKPKNLEQAKLMLEEMAGREVHVYTGTVVKFNNNYFSNVDVARVKLKQFIAEEVVERDGLKVLQRAGGFNAYKDVEYIKGSFFTVLGINPYFVKEVLLVNKFKDIGNDV